MGGKTLSDFVSELMIILLGSNTNLDIESVSTRSTLPHPIGTKPHTHLLGSLDLDRALERFPLLLGASNRFLAHDASAPVALRFLILIRVALLDSRDQLGQLGLVFGSDFG